MLQVLTATASPRLLSWSLVLFISKNFFDTGSIVDNTIFYIGDSDAIKEKYKK